MWPLLEKSEFRHQVEEEENCANKLGQLYYPQFCLGLPHLIL